MTSYKILLLQHFSDHNIKIIYIYIYIYIYKTQAIHRKPTRHFHQEYKLESVCE